MLLEAGLGLVDRGLVPDAVVRAGIRRLCRRRLAAERRGGPAATAARQDALLAAMATAPIAPVPELANAQHYELPAAFFDLVLGPHRKYSSCWWSAGCTDLEAAEAAALAATAERARLADGQRILELGCGWGSLSLWMAERLPAARILSVSNSRPQREFISALARERGLANLEVVTADVNEFRPGERFDRVVSVEMFEHVRNWRALLGRVRGWLAPGGLLFLHVFCHREVSYPFETEGPDDWMGRHFFSGGLMPSATLVDAFGDVMTVAERWSWDGTHYQRTADAWLDRMDRRAGAVRDLFRDVYGPEAPTWFARWRVFFMACSELFGYAGGSEWGVGHYLLRPVP